MGHESAAADVAIKMAGALENGISSCNCRAVETQLLSQFAGGGQALAGLEAPVPNVGSYRRGKLPINGLFGLWILPDMIKG